jgi:8-oxo-dGTP pyrophosphatase MutT (NUDIX family)
MAIESSNLSDDEIMSSRRPQQAAAIPFRRQGESVSVCLITAASSRRWGIPKGTIERGDSPEETALHEAWEEAGLRGRIVGESLGRYEYEKGGILLTVAVYLMEVETVAEHWQDQELRRRRWVATAEAARILRPHPAASLVNEACAVLEAEEARSNGDRRQRHQPPRFTDLLGNALHRLLDPD